ncbi:MAG: cobalamin-binding protein [Candidatus Obscuribacterales bacterium]|nr:cobalamin-binding protein [Candidatus Obscuribacterales bacterium]
MVSIKVSKTVPSKPRSSGKFFKKKPVPVVIGILSLVVGLPVQAEPTSKTGATTRIVSLAPSNTELLYSLGAQDRLVGVSSFCNYPETAKSKPRVGSFISVNWERLAKSKPDVVLLVSGQEPLQSQLEKHKVKTLMLNNDSLVDIGSNLEKIGAVAGCADRARKLSLSYQSALRGLNDVIKSENAPTVFYCIWPKPVITVGGKSFLNDVITRCGGINVASSVPAAYPKYGPEKVLAAHPEVVVLPFESSKTDLIAKPPWSLLEAVKKKRFFYLPSPDQDYLARPTLRIYQGLANLAGQLHPAKEKELRKWAKQAQSSTL